MIKKLCIAAASALIAALPAGATDVGVSVQISQPGVYGRVDIGRYPTPQLIVPQPVVIRPARGVAVRPEPVYLWVPPGHQKNWGKHCGRYNACGVPVYFVRDRWYQSHVMTERRERRDRDDDRDRREHHDHPGKGKGHGRGHGHGHGHD